MTSERGTNSERLVGALEAVWSSTATLCRDLTDEEWALPTRCPGWSVQDLVAHMLGTEAMLAGRSQPAVEVPDAPHLRNDIGRFNEAWIIERRSRRGADVLDEFVEITSDRLAALGRMDQAQFDEEAWTPAGKATYGRFMQIRVFDCWMHEQDARAAIDNLSATARLRVRLVHGSQDSAFAAALPLGLVLPKHLQVPAEVRGQL